MEKRKRNRPVLYEKGIRNELMRIMLTGGVISYDGLHMLDSHEHRMYTRKLKQMESEGVVEITRIGRKKYASLKRFDEKSEEYLSRFPIGYYKIYNNFGRTMKKYLGMATDKTKQQRAARSAEVQMAMYGSDVMTLADEKPRLTDNAVLSKEGCYYYSALEIKTEADYDTAVVNGNDGQTIINTRAIGCMISNGNRYIVYHTGDVLLKWVKTGEDKMAIRCGRLISDHIPDVRYREMQIRESIVFAKDIKTLYRLVANYDGKDVNLISTDCSYTAMYGLSYDGYGQALLRRMMLPNWKEEMRARYLIPEGYDTNQLHIAINADGCKEGVYVCLFCIPDLTRLRAFVNAAEINGNKKNYKIYCYDFQAPLVTALASDVCEIYTVSIE